MAERKEENLLVSVFETFRKQSLTFKVTIVVICTIIFVGIVGGLISLIVFGIVEDFDGQILIFFVVVIVILSGMSFSFFFFIDKLDDKVQNRRHNRKRRKQIRELGFDRLEDGEQAISSEELEERYNQRLATRQNSERRRPVIAILNERPSNETLLKKMTFKGKITGEKCSICKLDLRKKQTIIQCPKCYALFHYDHLNIWFEKNEDCPVCNEILVK